MKKKEKNKALKQKLKKTLLFTTAATSLVVNNAYDNPFDTIDDTPADESVEDENNQSSQKTGFKYRFHQLMGKIPLPIRAAILIPLWCIGWGLMLVIQPLFKYVINPYLSSIIYWAILAFLVLAIILVTVIFAFPGLPLKKIFNKKTICFTLLLLLILGITDKLLSMFNSDYYRISSIVKFSGCLLIIIAIVIYTYFKNRNVRLIASSDNYSFTVKNN